MRAYSGSAEGQRGERHARPAPVRPRPACAARSSRWRTARAWAPCHAAAAPPCGSLAEPAVEVDQRRLALLVDALEIRLQQHAALRGEQAADVRQDRRALLAAVALRIARAGADGRLHHQLARGVAAEKLLQHVSGGLPGLDELARDHGHPGAPEFAQIVLVDVPAHDLGRIVQPRQRRGTPEPGEEFAQARRVVPGRAQQRQRIARPVRPLVVPVHDLDREAAGMEAPRAAAAGLRRGRARRAPTPGRSGVGAGPSGSAGLTETGHFTGHWLE